MKITLEERISLLLNWPSSGAPLRLIILDEIKKLIVLNKEEREDYKIKETVSPEGRVSVTWDTKGELIEKEIELSKDQCNALKETLDKMEENFPATLIELYKKIN